MKFRSSKKSIKLFAIFIILILVIGSALIFLVFGNQMNNVNEISISEVLEYTSERNTIEEMVITSDDNSFYSLIATPIACWYDIAENGDSRYGLKPLLIAVDGSIDENQNRFIDYCGYGTALTIGSMDYAGKSSSESMTGTPAEVSLQIAKHTFLSAAGALIIEEDQAGYELGVVATPIASYLNIPVIIVDSDTNYGNLKSKLSDLHVRYTIVLGSKAEKIAGKLGFDSVLLDCTDEINRNVIEVVQHRFDSINYITMTNPSDVVPPQVIETEQLEFTETVNNVKVKTGNIDQDIVGESEHTFDIPVPDGLNRIQIYINFTNLASKPLDPLKQAIEVEPLIFAYLYDPNGRLVAYEPSFSYEVGKNYLETETFNCTGNFRLEVTVYYGTRGFDTYAGTQLGISRIEGTYEVSVLISELSEPHLPMFIDLSMMAPYISASHGGIVLADPTFELTDEAFASSAAGYGTGPWYETALHEATNEKVTANVEKLNQIIELFEEFDLKDNYLNGPAWLALLAGPNMLPQYYEPKDASYVEDVIYGVGWATDTKYSLDLQLSIARTLGRNVGEVSTMIARTLFYEPYTNAHTQMIKQQYGSSEDWGSNFHFLAGELGGRTGWFFWQREFANEVQDHGFEAEQYYRNSENDRQYMILQGAYERANYFDLMMHGNWYWYTTELNGMDSYSTSVKVSDIRKAPNDWELGPSMFISGSCLLGRIDGVSPVNSITIAFIKAGINAFYVATRSTGNEAKAGTIERSLMYEDFSVGEALRLDKLTNIDPPAFYVRLLFADPAFNPYEPENGFSDQGRPELVVGGSGNDKLEEEEGTQAIQTIPTAGTTASKTRSTSLEENDLDAEFAIYHTYDTISSELQKIAAEHSDITTLYSIGTTYENRDIWAMKVSDNPKENEDEPEVLYTGAHHGKEWPSYEVPLYFLKFIVENYGKCPYDNDGDGLVNEDIFDGIDNDGDGVTDEDEEESRITWLIDNRQLWFVPVVNPDGVVHAHGQVDAGETNPDNLWRKNREPNKNPATGQPYPEHLGGKNMWGTDLNRNYGFHWGEIGAQGTADPSREDYIGPVDKTDEDNDRRVNEDKMDNIDNDDDGKIDEDIRGGFSAVETQAIKKLVEEHDFVITLNYHTYAETIYWPWMWTLELTPDEELFCFLAKGMNVFNGYAYRDMSERRQEELSRHPPVDGDSNDWMYGKHGILAYTIELGTQFIPPEEEILPLCKLHLGSNLLVAEVADDPWQRKFEIAHEPLKDTANTNGYLVKVSINSTSAIEIKSGGVKLHYTTDGKYYEVIEMTPSNEPNGYEAMLPGQDTGTNISYYFSVTDMKDRITMLPKYSPNNMYSFEIISFSGEASTALLITHVIFIVGAIIFVIASGLYASRYLVKGKGINKSVQMAGIATGMIFIGGFPLGFALAYQVYGTPWTGIPFGWDITDNKTLVIFVYWLLSLFLIRGTIMNWFTRGRGRRCPFRWLISIIRRSSLSVKKERKDTISHNKFAKLAIIGAILTVALYLVPHSIMVSPLFSIVLFALLIGIFILPERKPGEVKFYTVEPELG
jgi:hypothetical protein